MTLEQCPVESRDHAIECSSSRSSANHCCSPAAMVESTHQRIWTRTYSLPHSKNLHIAQFSFLQNLQVNEYCKHAFIQHLYSTLRLEKSIGLKIIFLFKCWNNSHSNRKKEAINFISYGKFNNENFVTLFSRLLSANFGFIASSN